MYRKNALIQHPMYLLIREDESCAERTPPWGEPTIELYIERIRNNLRQVRENPQIKIGFEWSALELELLAQDAPAVFAEMRALAQAGRVAFYNGTYAQPHLQVLSSEANIRQFEFGSRVYRELCCVSVMTYAHQESSIHDQAPQILDAFGIRYSALPHFPSSLLWLDGGELLLRLGEPHFLHTQEFVLWRGLDGTELPLYLTPHRLPVKEWITAETMAGLMHGPTILIENRDLFRVTSEWLEERREVEPVILDDAFRERLAQSPPHTHVRHRTYWSYVEGIRAEELSRTNSIAERYALDAEALDAIAFVLLGRATNSSNAWWQRILASQHHDAACFCAPGLRNKAIGWLQDAASEAKEAGAETAALIAARVDTSRRTGKPLIVFNTTPHARRGLVTVLVNEGCSEVVDAEGRSLPVDAKLNPDGSCTVRFVAASAGLGYDTCWLGGGASERTEKELTEPLAFENEYYRAVIQPDGTFSSLRIKPSDAELLAQGVPGGNRLTATDSTGSSPQLNPGLTGKPNWQIPDAPRALDWQVTEPAHVRTTPIGMDVVVTGQLGPQVDVSLQIDLYHELPRIDFTYAFEFRDASIGIFYLDDTKLNLGWHLGFKDEIFHDIPFGVVKTEAELPFLPTTWVDISDGIKGLAYFHRGTFKHWVKEDILYNLFAWGEETNAIGDRIWRENWAKSFDQRLNGTHILQTAVLPHEGNWREANVVREARNLNSPLIGYVSDHHSGSLPSHLSLLNIREPEIEATSVQVRDSTLTCRVYSYAERPQTPTFATQHLELSALQTLRGDRVSKLFPYKIGVLKFMPETPIHRNSRF